MKVFPARATLRAVIPNGSQLLHGSRSTNELQALVARAFEAWIIGKHHMEALLADKPAWPLDHRPEAVTHYAIWTSNDRVIHFSLPFSRPT